MSLVGPRSALALVEALTTRQTGAHAVLLYGPQGAGKSAVARRLAQFWLCAQPFEGAPCGVCSSCRSFLKGMCPDLLEIYPSGPSRIIVQKRFQASRNEKLDPEDSTPLRPWLRTMPLAARHKVAYIHDADRMNRAAANTLLKTLEEPEPYARLILTTSAIGTLPATIVSRCLTVACELPQPEEAKQRAPHAEDWALRLAEYSPGYAEQIMACADVYQGLVKLADRLRSEPAGAAIRHSEDFRTLADRLGDRLDLNARTAQAEALRALATALVQAGGSAEAVQRIVETHRRVTGNAQINLALDALFASISGQRAQV